MTPGRDPAAYDDIATPRLILRLMDEAIVEACLGGDLPAAARQLGASIPDELLGETSGLAYSRRQLRTDPLYAPWSARAMIRRGAGDMVGLIRFHSCPDPEDLRDFARDAVEIGYGVFAPHRRRGYASEALGAMMDWARWSGGCSRFVASVSPDNTASLALIARFGFTRIGARMDEVDGLEHVFLYDAAAGIVGENAGPSA